MTKYLIGAAAILLIAAGGYYAWMWNGKNNTEPTITPTQESPQTYATSTFSLVHPAGYTADASYAYDQVSPTKPISGVKFTIPGTVATGTNLSGNTYISVEFLPRAKRCTGDIYLADNVRAQNITEGGIEYSLATSSGAGAGNFYEETVYALATSSPCTAVRYFIHSTNIGNYDPGTVREFDRAALLSAFDKIRQSLVLH